MKEWPIWFDAKTKTSGNSEGRPWRERPYSFPKNDWLRKGYGLFKIESGALERDFWLSRSLESEGGFLPRPIVLVWCK